MKSREKKKHNKCYINLIEEEMMLNNLNEREEREISCYVLIVLYNRDISFCTIE